MTAQPVAIDRLIAAVFDAEFVAFRIQLRGGHAEPYYQPPTAGAVGVLGYSYDYPASALHEAAHWCLAGARRRRCHDFGFDYVPTAARDAEQQCAFEAAEVRSQAIEWRFALAAALPFHVSIDCIGRDATPFRQAVIAEARRRCRDGWPPRADRFAAALAARFGGIATPLPQRDFV